MSWGNKMIELDILVNRYFQNVTTVLDLEGKKQYTGYVDGEEQYKCFLTDLNTLGFSFYSRSSNTNKSRRILFTSEKKNADINIPYFGSPFQIVRSTYLSCSQDGRYDPKPRKPPLVLVEPEPPKKQRGQTSKKIGCPAFMSVKCLRIFDEECYKLNIPYKESCRKKSKICKKLQEDLLASSPPNGILRFMIVISLAEEHNHTIDYSNLNQTLHPRLRKEIYNLVNRNVCCVETIKIVLDSLVKTLLDNIDPAQPDTSMNRCYRYYPSDQVIRFHIYNALFALKKNWHDQEGLEECINTWQEEYPDDNFLFRPFQVLTASEEEINLEDDPTCCTFVFCHQTKWQCDLLSRYGNDISLLDTTYKTCKYSFPLYFIIVKTNSGLCVVGTFIVQRASAILIEEALSQFKVWNPDWNPTYFMSDYSEAEVEAIKELFPQSIVYVCAFHREQSWYRWLNRKGNVAKEAVSVIKKLWQAIANSHTEEEYKQNLQEMDDCKVYQSNELAQRYFSDEWLPFYSRWVEAYYTKDFLFKVNINNGIDCQNKILTHPYLQTTKYKTLTGIVKAVLEDFLPDTIEKYSASNASLHSGNQKIKGEVPEFLKNRPIPFIENVILRFEKGKEYDASEINAMGDGLFMVRSDVKPDEWYPVDFQEASCSCLDFAKWYLPCKHMCAVFIHTDWGFDKLPVWYLENPYITIDSKYSTGIDESYVDTSTFVTDADAAYHPTPDMDLNQDEIVEEQYITVEEVDINKLWEEFRESLKTIEECSYLPHNPESILNFASVVRTLKDDMLSSATKSDEGLLLGLTDPEPPAVLEKDIPLKPIKKKYLDLTRRSKLKTTEKHGEQYETLGDSWYQWNTDIVDDCVPMAVDQYVEIDMV